MLRLLAISKLREKKIKINTTYQILQLCRTQKLFYFKDFGKRKHLMEGFKNQEVQVKTCMTEDTPLHRNIPLQSSFQHFFI